MAGFPTFTPRTANTAAIWRDVNPAASFLGGMKAVRQMDLDQAAEERLRESAEIDRMVKTSMLPLEMEKARADIALAMAGAGERAARAKYYGEGGAKALTDRQQRYEAANDPDALEKGSRLLPAFDALPSAPPSSPSEAGQIEYDNSGFQFNLTDDSDDFLSSAAETFPSANLARANYSLSDSPSELSAVLENLPDSATTSTDDLFSESALRYGAQKPQAGPKEIAEIKALAKSGDKTAKEYENPLSDFKTPGEESNPLSDFNVAPVSAMERTLKENENAFGGGRKQQTEVKDTLGNRISQFQNWDRSAKKALYQLQKSSPGDHQRALMAYDDATENFYANNFQGLDQDEINFLTKNPSKADRYMAYKSDFSPEESAFLTKINPSYADGIVKVFKEGKLPDGTPVIADSLDEAKAIYADAIRRGMKPATPVDPVKQAQERQTVMDKFIEIKAKAEEFPEDRTLQAAYQLSLNDIKSVYGDDWERVEFDLRQKDYAKTLPLRGQKVDINNKPVQGREAKTADQSRLEMIRNGLIPTIKATIEADGSPSFEEDDLNKIPDGAYFAGVDDTNAVREFRKINGKVKEAFPSQPSEEKGDKLNPPQKSKPKPVQNSYPGISNLSVEKKPDEGNSQYNRRVLQEYEQKVILPSFDEKVRNALVGAEKLGGELDNLFKVRLVSPENKKRYSELSKEYKNQQRILTDEVNKLKARGRQLYMSGGKDSDEGALIDRQIDAIQKRLTFFNNLFS